MRVAASLAAGAILTVTGSSLQIRQPRVLVMPFAVHAEANVPGGAAAAGWLGEAAASLLTEALAGLGVDALPREERVAVFDRLHVPMSAELTRATMIRVGELIGASEVVFGEVRIGTSLLVRARAMRLDSGRSLPDVIDAAALSDVFTLFGRLGGQIAAHAGYSVKKNVAAPAPLPLPALENFVKGLIAPAPASQQRFLEVAMGQAPHDARILTALWSVYADQGLHEKALAVASAVQPDSPLSRRARYSAALSLIELRRFDGAFRALSTLHGESRSGAVSNALGVVQLRRGATAGAADGPAFYFERATNETPGDTDYLFNVGYARALAGDTAGALLWLREVVRRDSGDGDAHLVMGALLSASGRTAEAGRELDLARLLGTSLETIPSGLVRVPPALERVRTSLDESGGVRALATPEQRDQRETALFHLERARVLIAEGKDREAVPELRRSIYLSPYEDEPHLLLGRHYQSTGRLGEAVNEYKVAIWARESAAARIALGSAFVAVGDRDAARKEFERALVLNPGSAEARDWLARIGG